MDFDGDGDLDMALVTTDGRAILLENRGGNANGWVDVALEGLPKSSLQYGSIARTTRGSTGVVAWWSK